MKGRLLTIAAIALEALLAQPLHLEAVGQRGSAKANTYSADLVQAMDRCASAVTNVDGVGGCPPDSSSTDGAHFTLGLITIRSRLAKGQVVVLLRSSTAAPPRALANKAIQLTIMLRVTRTVGNQPVTWVDQTLDCPNVTVPTTGDVLQKVSLIDCGLASATRRTRRYFPSRSSIKPPASRLRFRGCVGSNSWRPSLASTANRLPIAAVEHTRGRVLVEFVGMLHTRTTQQRVLRPLVRD